MKDGDEKKSFLLIQLEQAIAAAGKKLAQKLNKEIDKGNDTFSFTIAITLACLKDFLDIVLSFLLIGLIPGVNMLVGLFLTTFLYVFMLRKGWFLKTRIRIMYWVLGVFVDGLPGVSALPMNVLLVLYAWRLAIMRKRKAQEHLKVIHRKTLEEIVALEKDMSLLEKNTISSLFTKSRPLNNAVVPGPKTVKKIDKVSRDDLSRVTSKVTEENINLEPLKSAKAELDLRDAKYNKQKTEQNTLDLQNKRQEAADTGTNLPSRGESPLPRQVKNATMGDENEEQLAA